MVTKITYKSKPLSIASFGKPYKHEKSFGELRDELRNIRSTAANMVKVMDALMLNPQNNVLETLNNAGYDERFVEIYPRTKTERTYHIYDLIVHEDDKVKEVAK
jgi:hypothetical protein